MKILDVSDNPAHGLFATRLQECMTHTNMVIPIIIKNHLSFKDAFLFQRKANGRVYVSVSDNYDSFRFYYVPTRGKSRGKMTFQDKAKGSDLERQGLDGTRGYLVRKGWYAQ